MLVAVDVKMGFLSVSRVNFIFIFCPSIPWSVLLRPDWISASSAKQTMLAPFPPVFGGYDVRQIGDPDCPRQQAGLRGVEEGGAGYAFPG